jgi:hypothetical protein
MIDFPKAIAALVDPGVRFIVVGGLAGIAQGSARLTQDVDIVYERTSDNIRRLVAALQPYQPYPRGAPPGLPFVWDEKTVRMGLNFTLETTLGDIDVLGEIVGGGGYSALEPNAEKLTVFGRTCLCLNLEKLIETKRAAGRPKDFEAIAELEMIQAERRKP